MSQTTIIYNNIRIVNVLTDEMRHVPAMDQSGVDQIGTTVTGVFTGHVHCSQAEANTVGHQTGDVARDIDGIMEALARRRRRFTMMIGSETVYDIGAGAVEPGTSPIHAANTFHSMDIDNGPIPEVTQMTMTAGYSVTIRFAISFTIPTCITGQKSGLVNFRFTINEDIDAGNTWLTTRTYSGTLRVAHKNVNVHLLAREIAIPQQQRGFKREIVQMDESPDGLHLNFTVRDREIYAAAPWFPGLNIGATKWSGKLRMTTQNFSTACSELNLKLEGPKGTSKAALLSIISKVVEQKTHFLATTRLAAKGGDSAFLEYFGIEEDLAENVIECGVRILHSSDRGYQQMIGLFGIGNQGLLAKPMGDLGIGFDDQVAFQPGPSATLTGLFLCTLQTPCNPLTMPQIKDKPPKEKYDPDYGKSNKKTDKIDTVPSTSGETPSPGHLESMYLSVDLCSDLELSNGKIALPTGASSNSESPTQAIIQLHRPIANRVITMKAKRVGEAPEMPRPNVSFSDANNILHTQVGEAVVKSRAPQLSGDGRKLLYHGEISIRYAMSRAPSGSETVPVGALPYRTSPASDASRRIPPELFVNPTKLLT